MYGRGSLCWTRVLQEKQVAKALPTGIHYAQRIYDLLGLISQRLLADLQLLQKMCKILQTMRIAFDRLYKLLQVHCIC